MLHLASRASQDVRIEQLQFTVAIEARTIIGSVYFVTHATGDETLVEDVGIVGHDSEFQYIGQNCYPFARRDVAIAIAKGVKPTRCRW